MVVLVVIIVGGMLVMLVLILAMIGLDTMLDVIGLGMISVVMLLFILALGRLLALPSPPRRPLPRCRGAHVRASARVVLEPAAGGALCEPSLTNLYHRFYP